LVIAHIRYSKQTPKGSTLELNKIKKNNNLLIIRNKYSKIYLGKKSRQAISNFIVLPLNSSLSSTIAL